MYAGDSVRFECVITVAPVFGSLPFKAGGLGDVADAILVCNHTPSLLLEGGEKLAALGAHGFIGPFEGVHPISPRLLGVI